MKIGLRTPLSPRSGYGKDGFGLARALLDRGHDVRLSPSSVEVPLPRDVAGLLTRPFDGNFDLLIHHTEPQLSSITVKEAKAARKSILWTMWEWDSIEGQYWEKDFSLKTSMFDHIVGYTPQTIDAFVSYVGEDRLTMVQGGYESSLWKPPTESDEPHPYTYGMVGVLGSRKAPLTAIAAFLKLKGLYGDDFDAELILKTSIPILAAGATFPEGIRVIEDQVWSDEDMQDFYWWIDTLLCPSWGEGKNLPALEAGTSGTNLILSNCSGHTQWATSDIATILPTTPGPVLPDRPNLVGRRVSVDDLADAMWDAYTNRYQYHTRAQNTARILPAMMDWSKSVERLSLNLGLNL